MNSHCPETTRGAGCSPSPTTSVTPGSWTGFASAWCASAPASSRTTTTNIDQARLDLGKLFRIEDYPSKESLQAKFGIRYRIAPVPDADHFMARLASDDTARAKRDIERQIEERLHEAVGDLYRRLGEAVERVSERLQEGEDGKPLLFRNSMIENIRDLVDVVPRLNIFGDDRLARLCEDVKDRIAHADPDTLRPSPQFNPNVRRQVKRDADTLMEKFAGYFGDGGRGRPGGRVMSILKSNRIRRNRLFDEVPDRRYGHREAKSTTALAAATGLSRIVAYRLLADLEVGGSIQSAMGRVNGRAERLWWRQ